MAMPLRIMTQDFKLLGEISKYESLQITSEWSGIGEIELHVNRYMPNADKLLNGNIIFPHGRLDRAFVIEHKEIALDEAGKITENWMIKAPSLKTWFSQKPTVPPVGKSHIELNTDAESVMHALVEASVINPSDSGMKIENLIAGTNQKRGERIEWQSRYKVLSEELEKISKLSGIGWNIVVDRDNEKFIFETYEGLDLTEHNEKNPPAIFSPEFKTIRNLEYAESTLDYKNYAVVAGQGEGVDRRIVEVGDGSLSGTDRRVLFVDARDIEEEDEDGNAIPESKIIERLQERGEQKLAEHAQEVFLEGQALGTVVRKRDTSVNGVTNDVALDRVDLAGPGRNLVVTNGFQVVNHVLSVNNRGEKVDDKTFRIYANSPNGTALLFEKVGVSQGQEYVLNADMSDTISSYAGVAVYDKQGNLMLEPDLLSGDLAWVSTYNGYQIHRDSIVPMPLKFKVIDSRVGYVCPRFGIYRQNLTTRDVLIKEPKLELGSSVTPWQPAPEDGITWYNTDKTVHLDPINLSDIGTYTDSQFTWDVTTPSGTEAYVEYSFENRTWRPLGDSLPFTRNQKISGRLFIRIRLLTSNQTVTPSIRNFSYVINGYKIQGNPTLGRLTYGIDYNLGDITTQQSKEWGVTMDARITAVKEIYEPEKQAIELTFGNDRPTIFTKIKQELEGVKTEITR